MTKHHPTPLHRRTPPFEQRSLECVHARSRTSAAMAALDVSTKLEKLLSREEALDAILAERSAIRSLMHAAGPNELRSGLAYSKEREEILASYEASLTATEEPIEHPAN